MYISLEKMIDEVRITTNVRFIGVFGSGSRNKIEPEDLDVLVVSHRKKADLSATRPYHFVCYTDQELGNISQSLKYSILHDCIPLLGELRDLQPYLSYDQEKVISELVNGVEFNRGKYRSSVDTDSWQFTAGKALAAEKYACWLLFVMDDLSLPNNSKEIQSQLKEILSSKHYILKDFNQTLLNFFVDESKIHHIESTKNMEEITGFSVEHLVEKTLNFSWRVSKLAMEQKLVKDFHVHPKISNIDISSRLNQLEEKMKFIDKIY